MRQGTLSRSGPDEATLAAITSAVSPAGTTAGGAAAAKRALEVCLVLDVGAAPGDCLTYSVSDVASRKASAHCVTYGGIRGPEQSFQGLYTTLYK